MSRSWSKNDQFSIWASPVLIILKFRQASRVMIERWFVSNTFASSSMRTSPFVGPSSSRNGAS